MTTRDSADLQNQEAALPETPANVEMRGVDRRGLFVDIYHRLMRVSWPRLLALLVGLFLGVNTVFALGYLAIGDGITNARHGSFADAFFFSVQTIATIGYGVMSPRSLSVNLLVLSEVFVGLVGLAFITGLTFARFSRPTARVRFSRFALITPRDGVSSLVFRMANERGDTLVEASAHVILIRNEITPEGESVRRFHDLQLQRERNLLFALSWTVVHPITESSPLHGAGLPALAAAEAAVVVSVLGLDESLGQTVHARHTYTAADLRWNIRFADILGRRRDGQRFIDYSKFDEVVPLSPQR